MSINHDCHLSSNWSEQPYKKVPHIAMDLPISDTAENTLTLNLPQKYNKIQNLEKRNPPIESHKHASRTVYTFTYTD